MLDAADRLPNPGRHLHGGLHTNRKRLVPELRGPQAVEPVMRGPAVRHVQVHDLIEWKPRN